MSYDPFAKALHWGMALLVIGLWFVGLSLEALPKGDFRGQVIGLHKSVGVVVLMLVVVRLAWRATHRTPDLPATMAPWERLGARLGHMGLYALMVVIPVDGILLSQTGGRAVSVLGWTLPTVIGKSEFMHEVFEEAHEAMAWVLAALIVVHVAAALKHHFIVKDDVLRRMLPGR